MLFADDISNTFRMLWSVMCSVKVVFEFFQTCIFGEDLHAVIYSWLTNCYQYRGNISAPFF